MSIFQNRLPYCTEWSAVKEAYRELTAVIGISPSIDIDEALAE
jgi:hypothetical protein